MKYDFDEAVDRAGTDSLTVDGWREYMFGAHEGPAPEVPANGFINLWVADMAFSTPEPVLEAIRSRLDKKFLATPAFMTEITMIFLGPGVKGITDIGFRKRALFSPLVLSLRLTALFRY